MRKVLVVIDMQNDFIDGALGTKEAQAMLPLLVEKLEREEALKPFVEKAAAVVEKPTFGSLELPKVIAGLEPEAIELVGLCTDICVIANAMILKAAFPEVPISVDASCCAGVTPESHENALQAMKMCQVAVR